MRVLDAGSGTDAAMGLEQSSRAVGEENLTGRPWSPSIRDGRSFGNWSQWKGFVERE